MFGNSGKVLSSNAIHTHACTCTTGLLTLTQGVVTLLIIVLISLAVFQC